MVGITSSISTICLSRVRVSYIRWMTASYGVRMVVAMEEVRVTRLGTRLVDSL